jgi:hypothetical protein
VTVTNLPWSGVLLEKLIVTQLVKNPLPPLCNPKVHYRHRSLSWARWIQSTLFHPVSLRLILILSSYICLRGCVQKFPDWPPEMRTEMVQLSTTRRSSIAILWVRLVSFAVITLYVASQLVFISVSTYFIMTQSGNVWIHPRMFSECSVSLRFSLPKYCTHLTTVPCVLHAPPISFCLIWLP